MKTNASGFTLIELLVVIAIIGLLAVALMPSLSGISQQGSETATMARIELLRAMLDKYESVHGEYPPSDFSKAMKGVNCKVDGTNVGIECMMIHLHQRNLGPRFSLEDKETWLGNTDEDDNGAEIPELRTTEKLEVVDAWLNPIAYFRADSYRQPQEVTLSDGDGGNNGGNVTVNAMKGKRGYRNVRSYQLISAGADAEFGTDDDISYPETVPQ